MKIYAILIAALALICPEANAQVSDDVIKIGVLRSVGRLRGHYGNEGR